MKWFGFIFFISLSAYTANGEKAFSEKRIKLSFTEFIKLAEKNDPNFKFIMSDAQRIKFLVDLDLPARQLLLQAQGEYGISVQDNQNTTRYGATLLKNFIETGTAVSVSHNQNELADRDEQVTEFRLEQSLYRNFFGKNTRLQKESLEDEVKSLKMQIVDTYEAYMLDLGTLYLDYSQSWRNVKLAEEILQETITLKNNVQKMKRNNIASETDLNRAKLQVTLRQEDLISLESQMRDLGIRLATLADLPAPVVVPEIESFEPLLAKVDVEKVAFEDLRVAKIANLRQEVAEKELTLAKSLNDPTLNLIAGYNFDKSTRFGTLVNREEQILGLNLEVPIGNSQNKALEGQANLEKLKAKLEASNQKREILQSFKSLKNQLKNAKRVMELNQEKVKISEKVYKADLRRYQFGNLPLDRLIEAKNAYSQFRYQFFTSSASYYKIALRWLSFSDKLVEKKL